MDITSKGNGLADGNTGSMARVIKLHEFLMPGETKLNGSMIPSIASILQIRHPTSLRLYPTVWVICSLSQMSPLSLPFVTIDPVAHIHTGTPTKKSKINVDLIHINALLGYMEAVLIGGVKSLNLDRDTGYKAIAAFGKLLCNEGAEYFEASTTKTIAVVRSNQSFFSRLLRYFF
ncbi:hypothetical protein BGX34_010916 [Mortierella sp. NVP85]|nr:hypothetical protein BGX34_010916 [Mortierella sp. NVP85]